MSPNKHVSSAAANNPIRIIFVTCNHGRSAAKRATNSPSRSAARITGRSIALATSRPGGRRPASTPLRSPVSSGDKPGSMMGKSVTRRVSRRTRRLHQLPRPLMVRGSRGPTGCHRPSGRRSSAVSSTDVLLNIATAARLFHATDGTGFADLIIDGHRETWPLRSKRFKTWLRQQYYERTWNAPSPAALSAGLNVLEAQAQFDGPQRKVSVRLAEQDGMIYLD